MPLRPKKVKVDDGGRTLAHMNSSILWLGQRPARSERPARPARPARSSASCYQGSGGGSHITTGRSPAKSVAVNSEALKVLEDIHKVTGAPQEAARQSQRG